MILLLLLLKQTILLIALVTYCYHSDSLGATGFPGRTASRTPGKSSRTTTRTRPGASGVLHRKLNPVDSWKVPWETPSGMRIHVLFFFWFITMFIVAIVSFSGYSGNDHSYRG